MDEEKPSALQRVSTQPLEGTTDTPIRKQDATPVSEKLSTVVIAISNTKHSEYSFNWALNHFIQHDGNQKVN
jgi:hypothetical protein